MKYLILLTDGAADKPIDSLGGRTPLEAAALPHITRLAQNGSVGLVSTIPAGISPGSDAANLSVMGFDPSIYHTGRSPLEAVSMGIQMADTDVAFRCNLVTLTGEGDYEDLTILDHSSGDISNEEAAVLMQAINEAFGTDTIQFYAGISYRHAMIVKNGSVDYQLVPPHDVLTQKAGLYLPKGEGKGKDGAKDSIHADQITDMMKRSYQILSQHPVNLERQKNGLRPANSIWIWGQGTRPRLTSFTDKYGVTGAVISAVDLIKGIGLCAGLKSIDVEGATGTLHTNYKGKADATIQAFQSGLDFVYVHIEAPDECSHQGDLEGKIQAMEHIDQEIAGPVLAYLQESGEAFRILVMPDHPTPMALRTHTADPVPFVYYDSQRQAGASATAGNRYSEASAQANGLFYHNGYELTDAFFKG